MERRTCAVDGELFPPHELVDELRDEFFGVLVWSVDIIAPRNHDGEVEGPRGQSRKDKKDRIKEKFRVQSATPDKIISLSKTSKIFHVRSLSP